MATKHHWLLLAGLLTVGLMGCESNDDDDSEGGDPNGEKPEPEAYLTPVIAEAEGGGAGVLASQGADVTFTVDSENPGIEYVTAAVDNTEPPENVDDPRVVTLDISFPYAGEYQIYTRLRVGPDGSNDDSFYVYPPSGEAAEWQLLNGVSGFIVPGEDGYQEGQIIANPGGTSATGVWKWALLGDLRVVVPEGELSQTFSFATREDGLDIDKFAFTLVGDGFTVGLTPGQLDAGQDGVELYPPELPPAYEPPSDQPPLAQGLDKFLGGVCCGNQRLALENYFNQVTPENAGKWGSVEATRDEYNWEPLDEARDVAVENGFPFRFHVLVWGNQQPEWIKSLPPAEQREEIREWFEAVNERYGEDIDMLEVVNEFDNDPPNQDDTGGGNYIEALGGTGATGYDWIVTAFTLADEIFPDTAQLMLNEYSVINSDERTDRYIEVVNLLLQDDLIDAIGVQGHAFSTRGPVDQMVDNIDRLGATGLPVYITEMDLDGPPTQQLIDYVRLFPEFWENRHVQGITLWGYREGMWREDQEATLVYSNGAEKPALRWLKGYLRGTAPLIAGPESVTVDGAAVGTTIATFSARTPEDANYPEGTEVQWGLVDGTAVEALTFVEGTGELQLANPLSAGDYTVRLYADVDATLSRLYELALTVE